MTEEFSASPEQNNSTGTDESNWDQSKRAEAVLNTILNTPAPGAESLSTDQTGQVTVTEALRSRPVLQFASGRAKARVLFVTTEESALVPESAERKKYIKLAEQFDELHVICLVNRSASDSYDRAGGNVWFYKVHYSSHWSLKKVVKQAAADALTWNDDFRPDVVIGIDPFEAGLAAYVLAKTNDRPLQLHVSTNHLLPDFKARAPENKWRYRTARGLYKRVKSVRVTTSRLKEALQKEYKKLLDIEVLPRFYNFAGLEKAVPAFDLRQKYPDFAFVMLAFGPLTADSHLHDLFSALHRLLRNPRLGLIVIGTGPMRELFMEKVKLLGIEKSVVFQDQISDLASYLKTANVLVEVATSDDAEVRVLQAAAAGLPVVAVATDLRSDLFEDGNSILLSNPNDLLELADNVSKLINSVTLRKRLSDAARFVAESRLHEDPNAHFQALAMTIESVLLK